MPGRALDDMAAELVDDGQWAVMQQLMREGAGPEADALVLGYSVIPVPAIATYPRSGRAESFGTRPSTRWGVVL